MRKITKRSFSVAAAVIAAVLIPAMALAAWYFLSPADIADQLEFPVLAQAFRSEDALLVNETKSDNGYDVSFLGIVSGKGLVELDHTVDISKSYAVVAIAKQGGSMPAVSDDDYGSTPFFVSPLIHGQRPWLYNIASMGGGYSACVIDGIMYRLIECDGLEMFADRGLTLIVSSTSFFSVEAFSYDEVTGLTAPIPDFDGVNLMFDLPLDTSKADYESAQQYLDALWDDSEAPDTRESGDNVESGIKSTTDPDSGYTADINTQDRPIELVVSD